MVNRPAMRVPSRAAPGGPGAARRRWLRGADHRPPHSGSPTGRRQQPGHPALKTGGAPDQTPGTGHTVGRCLVLLLRKTQARSCLLCSIPPGRQSTGPDDYSHRNRPPERTQRLMSIWPSIVAVLGTLAGALTAGLLQHRSARTARAEERAHNHRQDQLGAVTDFAAALDAYRSAIFHRERLALTEAGTEHQLEGRPRSGLPAGRSAPPCRCGCGSRLHRLRRATEVPHRTLFTLPWLWQLRWRVPHGGLSWPPRSGGSLRGWA